MVAKAIYLNGTSSSGKTTLSRYLQDILPEIYFYTGIDLLIREMLPKKYFFDGSCCQDGFYWQQEDTSYTQPLMHVKVGPVGIYTIKNLIGQVDNLLAKGESVIIDDVAVLGAPQVTWWQQMLSQYCHILVAVKCPLEVIQQREYKRKDRMLGSGAAQYYTVHNGVNCYDLEVDTATQDLPDIAQQIIASLDLKYSK